MPVVNKMFSCSRWVASLLLLSVVPVVNGEDLLLPVFDVSFAAPPYFEVRQRRPFAPTTTTSIFGGVEPTFSTTGIDATSATITTSTTPTSQGDLNVTNDTRSTTVSAAEEQDPLSFPLQSTSIDAKVANGVAHVLVTQAYENTGEECLDTRYIIPLPPTATISAMTMFIGDRVVRAEIREKEQAREDFEEAQSSGQSAGLLELDEQGAFTMELANILPGDVVQVVVEYLETLVAIDGIFAFTFPAVVAPRYAEDIDSGSNLTADSNLSVDVTLEVMPSCLGVDSDLPLQLSESAASTRAMVMGADADIIVKFWFTEREIDAKLLLSRDTVDGTSGYFSLAVLPPQRPLLNSTQIIAARDYVFILDPHFGNATAGNEDPAAEGARLSKALIKKMLREHLRPGDMFSMMILTRSGRYYSQTERMSNRGIEVAEHTLAWAESFLDRTLSYNFTNPTEEAELSDSFGWAFRDLVMDSPGVRTRNVVLLTSGHMVVRENRRWDPDWHYQVNLGRGSLFVIGLLPTLNYPLIKSFAEVGYGSPFLARSEAEGMQSLEQMRALLDWPVLANLELRFTAPDYGKFEWEPRTLPDVLAGRPLQVAGKWWTRDFELFEMTLQGRLADGTLWRYAVNLSQIRISNLPSLRLQWARSRIAFLSNIGIDREGDTTEAVTQLGLEHSLVTPFTSFVAVDSDTAAPDVCGAATTTATTSTATSTFAATTTDRYGFGSDDDDDWTYVTTIAAVLDTSGTPVGAAFSLCCQLLMLWQICILVT